jgi:hypothetical protein
MRRIEIFMGKLEQMYYAEKGKYMLSDKEQDAFDDLLDEFKFCKDKFLFFYDDDEQNRISCLTTDEMAEKYKNGNYSDPDNLIENCLDFCLYSSIHVLRMFKNMELSDILNTFREKGLKI